MSDFPTISRSPDLEEFIDEYPPESVKGADYASGHPLVDVQYTALLMGFRRKLRHVSETDKDSIKDHYEDNRGNAFNWLDVRVSKQYEVVYDPKSPPKIQLEARNDTFQIILFFLQNSTTVTDITTTTTGE